MKKLYSGTDPNSIYIGAEVPSKQGVVLEVDPNESYIASRTSHVEMILGRHKTEEYGLMHNAPRVVVRFKTSATGDKTLSAEMPVDSQYHLSFGDSVVVYSDEFAEPGDVEVLPPPGRVDLDTIPEKPAVYSEILRRLTDPGREPFPLNPEEPIIRGKPLENSIRKKYEQEENPRREADSPDPRSPFYPVPVRTATPLKELLSPLERAVALAGMQVLDEKGRVRYECVCQPGMRFR